jgi:hypothetical protein
MNIKNNKIALLLLLIFAGKIICSPNAELNLLEQATKELEAEKAKAAKELEAVKAEAVKALEAEKAKAAKELEAVKAEAVKALEAEKAKAAKPEAEKNYLVRSFDDCFNFFKQKTENDSMALALSYGSFGLLFGTTIYSIYKCYKYFNDSDDFKDEEILLETKTNKK